MLKIQQFNSTNVTWLESGSRAEILKPTPYDMGSMFQDFFPLLSGIKSGRRKPHSGAVFAAGDKGLTGSLVNNSSFGNRQVCRIFFLFHPFASIY